MAEKRVSRQLDIVHFFQNAIVLEALSKLYLRKSDRFLIHRQPKVHLLNQAYSYSSDSSLDQTINVSSQQSDDLPDYGPQLLEMYFGSKDKASIQPDKRELRNPLTTNSNIILQNLSQTNI